jgi:hypothetical protein
MKSTKKQIKHLAATDGKPPVMGSASPKIKKEDDKYKGYHKCPNCGIRHVQINDHINHMDLCNMISFY